MPKSRGGRSARWRGEALRMIEANLAESGRMRVAAVAAAVRRSERAVYYLLAEKRELFAEFSGRRP